MTFLRPVISLKEVVFCQNGASNPICDFNNYLESTLQSLPQIVRLDGRSIYELGVHFAEGNKVVTSANANKIATPNDRQALSMTPLAE